MPRSNAVEELDLDLDAVKGVLVETPSNIWTPGFMTLQSGITEYEGQSVKFHVSSGYDPLWQWKTFLFTD